MRQLINLCEKRNKTIRIGKYNFKKIRRGDMDGNQLYIVMDDDGNSLAAFSIDRNSRRDENALCVHLNVDEHHRRRGIGTLIYEFVEKNGGRRRQGITSEPTSHQRFAVSMEKAGA